MYEMIEVVNAVVPENKPRYLMGVGTPVNILEAIDRGVDMFDCVLPTRNGRNGMLYTRHGVINIRNNKWSSDFSPLEEEGASQVDTHYSKAYLRHLFQSKEMLGPQLASIHNLAFFLWLVGEARKQILDGNFKKWKEKMVEQIGKRL
jgi:queuine tRNA-ribosyltransferase